MSFQELKDKPPSALVLTISETKQIIYNIHRCVKEHVSMRANAGRKRSGLCISALRPHEVNYHPYDVELKTVVRVLKDWRPYLYGSRLEIYIDHNLKYF